MKKLALLLLTFVSFGMVASAADVAVNGKLTTWAGLETNATDFSSDGSDSLGYVYVNAELNTAIELSDNVKVVLELELNDKVSNGASLNDIANTNTVELDEAYVQVSEFLMSNLTLKVGHQFVENSLRKNHRAVYLATNLTAFKGTFSFDQGFVDLFYGKQQESLRSVNGSNDVDVYGAYGEYNFTEDIHVIGYLNNTTADNAGASHSYSVTVGAGVDWFLLDKKLELFLEVAGQFGEISDTVDRSGFAVDLGAKWDFGEIGIKGLSIELNGSFRTGQDKKTDSTEFYEGLAQRTGALIAEADYNLSSTRTDNPMYKGYAVGGYTAIRLEVDAQWTEKLGSNLLVAWFGNNDDGADPFGVEVDIGTSYKHTENLLFALHLGIFLPDDGLTGGSPADDDPVFALAFETTVSF